MKIKGIEAQNFRNLKDIKLDFGDVNIIYGENAQGKTNLLEAIYLLPAQNHSGAQRTQI